MMSKYVLLFLPLLVLVQGCQDCQALPTWDQAEVMLEDKNTTAFDNFSVEFTDLAAKLHDMLEKMSQIMQPLTQPVWDPHPARNAKAGQQLVWAVVNETVNQSVSRTANRQVHPNEPLPPARPSP